MPLALKGIVHDEIPEDIRESQLRKVENEIEIQSNIEHPNILKLIGVFRDPYCHVLVYEKMSEDLFDRISRKRVFEEDEACEIIRQIIRAVNYLHKNSIVHRDIKPENVAKINFYKRTRNLFLPKKFRFCSNHLTPTN